MIALFAILPGMAGSAIYRLLVGLNRRDDGWWKLLRLLVFSVSGLALYIVVASIFVLPLPPYLMSSSFFDRGNLPELGFAYGGHVFGSALVGLTAAYAMRLFARWTPMSPFPDTWDAFIRSYAKEHWVIVSLVDGAAYAGLIREADISVIQEERDVVLKEPAKYDQEKEQYLALNYQYLFIPAARIDMIAAVHNPKLDRERITKIGESIF